MGWISASLRELVALFVDDGSLAVIALIWLAVCGLVLPPLGIAGAWLGLALFAGLAIILAENALRAARRKRVSR
jgi:Na+-driven multidrug efflux pump